MSMSSSIQSYSDCLDFFEKVVDDPKGGRVFIGSWEDAHQFRMRCNKARQLHRQQNARIYHEGDKMHGVSEYDPLCLRIKIDTAGSYWLYAERMQLNAHDIELLSEIDDTPQITDEAPLQIEDKSDAKA